MFIKIKHIGAHVMNMCRLFAPEVLLLFKSTSIGNKTAYKITINKVINMYVHCLKQYLVSTESEHEKNEIIIALVINPYQSLPCANISGSFLFSINKTSNTITKHKNNTAANISVDNDAVKHFANKNFLRPIFLVKI
jgi:hypothetical protein